MQCNLNCSLPIRHKKNTLNFNFTLRIIVKTVHEGWGYVTFFDIGLNPAKARKCNTIYKLAISIDNHVKGKSSGSVQRIRKKLKC